jgi:fumarate reductase subunit C
MTKENNQNKLKQIIDNLLLINLFTVIFFAIFFIFAIIMQLNGIFIFINFIQIVWNPLVVPLITILIIGALVNGINSWWRRKLLSQEEDI